MNINKYLKAHTQHVKETLLKGKKKDFKKLKQYHKERIEFMQHERLIHLLVTLTFAILLILSLIMAVMYTKIEVLVLLILLLALLISYIFHYFFMENTVQQWYKLMDEIDKRR